MGPQLYFSKMGSPRQPRPPLNLAPHTYGDSPAAIYLVELLNQKQDVLLARKAAKVLAEGRELLGDVARAHLDYDALSTRSFSRLLTLLSEHHQKQAANCLRAHDEHVANLVVNILEGGVKTWKRRVELARRQEKKMARQLPSGSSVQWVPAKPLLTELTSETLRRRSKSYLQRKGKRDTLY